MKVVTASFVLFVVSTTLAVPATDKIDAVLTEIVNHLKENQTSFRDFHLFRAVDVATDGPYTFNSIEVLNTNINFQDAILVPGGKGWMSDELLVIEEAKIKMPTLIMTGSIVVYDDTGFNFTVPFSKKQDFSFLENGETEGTFTLTNFSVRNQGKKIFVSPGVVTYSPQGLFRKGKVNCVSLIRYTRTEECAMAMDVVDDLGLASIAQSLGYKMRTAIKHMQLTL